MDLSGIQPAQITEFVAVAIASFAIICGIGATTWKGYQNGKCLLPRSFVWMVNTPLGVAMLLRIATFILDGKYYYFFIAVDAIGAILAVVVLLQTYGYLVKREPL